MIEAKAKDCLQAVQGELLKGSEERGFRGVSIDSRTVKADELFFCIRGDRFDGHDFLADALKKNVAGIVLSQPAKLQDAVANPPGESGPFIIRVADTLNALQELARFYRKQIPVRVVGVTGTNGKSTTKEMIAAIAETRFKTLKTQGNLNNHIGLPLSVLKMDRDHEVAVLEMGMSAAGEIRRLAEIAQPDIGLITNISAAHLVELKSVQHIQAAKGELFEALGDAHTAIVNADDPLVLELARSLKARTITFAIDNAADVRAGDIRPLANDGFDFSVRLFDKDFPLRLPFLGSCNIYNALAAMAAGYSLGVPAEDMAAGLHNCRRMPQRYEIIQHNSMTLINDAYNANPISMMESLKTLSNYATRGRRMLVIGDMLELGEQSRSAHLQLGREIAGRPIDLLVTVGELAALAAQGAREQGMENGRVVALATREEAIAYLKKNTRADDCLLFKGSRGAAMERVLHGLTEKEPS